MSRKSPSVLLSQVYGPSGSTVRAKRKIRCAPLKTFTASAYKPKLSAGPLEWRGDQDIGICPLAYQSDDASYCISGQSQIAALNCISIDDGSVFGERLNRWS